MENSVFIGFDRREILPWHVLCHSILARSSKPVSISAVKLSQLPLSRPVQGSTEFSISRFMVPWMCGYKGLALFMDCDMLVRMDVSEIFAMHDGSAVQVVQHDYTPKDSTKFYGNKQEKYPMKNWSSVMLMDCAQCKVLTPEYVNTASPMELHQFHWTNSLGALPARVNHLVGEYPHDPNAGIIHWTIGGPWLEAYENSDYAADWCAEYTAMTSYLDE